MKRRAPHEMHFTERERMQVYTLARMLRVTHAAAFLGTTTRTLYSILGLSKGRRLRAATRARIRERLHSRGVGAALDLARAIVASVAAEAKR